MSKPTILPFCIPVPGMTFEGQEIVFGELQEADYKGQKLLYMLCFMNQIPYGYCVGFRTEPKAEGEKPGDMIKARIIEKWIKEMIEAEIYRLLEKHTLAFVVFFE